MINSNSFGNLGKVKVLLHVLFGEAISELQIAGENDINRHNDTSKHKGYANAAQRKRKLTDFGTTSANANLD